MTAAGLCLATLAVACVPEPTGPTTPGETTTTSTTTTTTAPALNPVSGVQLSWAYSQYAQYGVFGQWSQNATGQNVQVNTVDGEAVTGLAAEAGVRYYQGQFDGGTGFIDPTTGEGQITWATGDWVLNAYNGLFGAPDETLSDPILTIGADGSGTLSFEASIPYSLDIDGSPAGSAGPERITIATFSSVELTGAGLRITPDFAGRSYVPDGSSYGAGGTVSCLVDGVETGGSWPAEWIDFLPPSVRAHYFTTGCGGLNLRKPPASFTATWAPSDAAIVYQPTLSATSLYSSAAPRNFGARVGISGVPTPQVQWQRSLDGTTWTDIAGATSTVLDQPFTIADTAASFRALVAGVPTDVIGPITVLDAPATILGGDPTKTVGRGEPLALNFVTQGSPIPTVTWERSDDNGATWSTVEADGITTFDTSMTSPGTATAPGRFVAGLRYEAATDAENGAQFRVRATNGLGAEPVVVSAPTIATVRWDLPSFTTQPPSTAAFTGQEISISAFTAGLPKPTVTWELSTDGGTTWTTTPSATESNFRIEAGNVTMDNDGLQVRVVATSAAGTTVSDVSTIRVFERTGGRQLIAVPSGSIDPTARTQFTIIGAGWDASTVGNMRVAITNSSVWQPGQNGVAAGQTYAAATVTRNALTSTGGLFRVSPVVAPNAITDPSLEYGVATFGVTVTDHFYDSWTPIDIAWPTP